jgi:hypothetical protein
MPRWSGGVVLCGGAGGRTDATNEYGPLSPPAGISAGAEDLGAPYNRALSRSLIGVIFFSQPPYFLDRGSSRGLL